MVISLEQLISSLPGVSFFERSESIRAGFWIGTGGVTAYGGALRLFPSRPVERTYSVDEWNDPGLWKASFKEIAPPWPCIGEDAFGTQFMLSRSSDRVALFLPETGQVEYLDGPPTEFLKQIVDDPDATLSLNLFCDAVRRHGALPLSHHFAFCVETALGGAMDVSNVEPMEAVEHMRALGEIALQIKDVAVGTPLEPRAK